jgi:hypothetical protein
VAAEVMKADDGALLADEMGGLMDALLKVRPPPHTPSTHAPHTLHTPSTHPRSATQRRRSSSSAQRRRSQRSAPSCR